MLEDGTTDVLEHVSLLVHHGTNYQAEHHNPAENTQRSMLGEHEGGFLCCVLFDLIFCELGQVDLESFVEITEGQSFVEVGTVDNFLFLLERFFGFWEDDHFSAIWHG